MRWYEGVVAKSVIHDLCNYAIMPYSYIIASSPDHSHVFNVTCRTLKYGSGLHVDEANIPT